MKTKSLSALAIRKYTKVHDIARDNHVDGTSSFRDVAINLARSLLDLMQAVAATNNGFDAETKRVFRSSLVQLNRYLSLINNYPEFRDKEFHADMRSESYFPDIRTLRTEQAKALGFQDPNIAYINLAKERLASK